VEEPAFGNSEKSRLPQLKMAKKREVAPPLIVRSLLIWLFLENDRNGIIACGSQTWGVVHYFSIQK
jgi:hypothetical protein